MKKLVLASVTLGVLAFGNQPAHAQNCTSYQTSGPYYATPSWDQKLVYFQRFICLTDWNNEAVLDKETGLVWQRTPIDFRSPGTFWRSAAFECYSAQTGNRMGWRLPTADELASLIDPAQNSPALPAGHPFQQILPLGYWTASPASTNNNPSAEDLAFQVIFAGNGQVTDDFKFNNHLAWCVRGGSHVFNVN